MTRVLMVLSNGFTHDPRVSQEAESLARAGYDMTVLAFDVDGSLPIEETKGGVRVVRVRGTKAMRMRPALFRLRPFWRLALRRALALHFASPFQAIHCHDLDTLPVGVRFKRRTGVRLVYDAHEVFPYLVELSRAAPLASRYEALERRQAAHVDLAIAASPPIREYLQGFVRVPIVEITNSRPLETEAYDAPRNERMVVAYFGGMEPSRLLVPLAEIAAEGEGIEVHLAGSGPLVPEVERIAAGAPDRVRFLGLLPPEEVMPRTRAADVVFAVFDPAKRINRIGFPNKVFEALAAGRPLLVSEGTWAATLVADGECGVAVSYSKEGVRGALATLQRDPALRERLGRNALRLAVERYNWAAEERKLLAAYARIGVRA